MIYENSYKVTAEGESGNKTAYVKADNPDQAEVRAKNYLIATFPEFIIKSIINITRIDWRQKRWA